MACHALVLELVEGETLDERLQAASSGLRGARTGLPLAEALPMANQIATAVEAAHEKGVVHRDLKPANIKITPDGAVKVLDFGLAKAWQLKFRRATASPLTRVWPQQRSDSGHASLHAPEQARGTTVDHRSDIWAFGCVLFEMLTGRRAFPGETCSDTIAAILGLDPDWRALPGATPPIRRLLLRCVEKDARRRLRDIGDARIELEGRQRVRRSHPSVPQPASRLRERLAWLSALALVTLIAIATGRLGHPSGGAPARGAVRYQHASDERPVDGDGARRPDAGVRGGLRQWARDCGYARWRLVPRNPLPELKERPIRSGRRTAGRSDSLPIAS